MTDENILLSADKAFLIAPAGCGKTQLIAKTVCIDPHHRSLILTHTYAGIDSLRRRLNALKAGPSTYEVETIAGWCLRLTSSFPTTSGITTQRPIEKEWNNVYAAAKQLLCINAIKIVISASYDSVYVDEYQDCSPLQHEMILKLSEILPTRILGDPLQGIFGFDDSGIIDWNIHVKPYFKELPQLIEPHRWKEKNPELGNWLLAVRKNINLNDPVDMRQAPNGSVRYIELPYDPKGQWKKQTETCRTAKCPQGQSLLVIHSWEPQCHKIARQSGGKFRSPETIECNALFEFAREFDNASDRASLAKAVFKFACLCLTKVNTELEKISGRIFDGSGFQQGRQYKNQEQLDSLKEIIKTNSFISVRKSLVMLSKIPEARKARHELFFEMLNALREYETGRHECLEEAAILSRERTRRTGRALGKYVISRTLLVKGLEFDHVIILDGDSLDRKNLYVALTRASRSLTVLSRSPILKPK